MGALCPGGFMPNAEPPLRAIQTSHNQRTAASCSVRWGGLCSLFQNMDNQTLPLLAFLTQSTWSQFESAKVFNEVHRRDSDEDLPITEILPHPLFAGINIDHVSGLTLKHTPERQVKLEHLVYSMTLEQFRWVQDAKATKWHATSWSSDASHLFMQSESLGISGTASYAIVAAVITMQGFQVPGNLQTRLAGAKQNAEQIRSKLRQADTRRAAQLKRKDTQQ